MEHRTKTRGHNDYLVRAVLPSDEPSLLNLLEHLSADEIRLRFFAFIRHFSHDMAARMTQIDYDREVTLVAFHAEKQDMVIGIATIVSDPDGREAEYAVLVHHDHVRQGLGRHLLECLLSEAIQRGISKVHGDVLADNVPMLNLVQSLGFTARASVDDPGCRRVEIILESVGTSQVVPC
jgi:GNAT superfamily N-acetyltransferase